MLGKRHVADLNQNIAEPHAAIIAPVSMNGLIITPDGWGWIAIILAAKPNYHRHVHLQRACSAADE